MNKKKKDKYESIKENNKAVQEWYYKEMLKIENRYSKRCVRAVDFGKGVVLFSAIGFLLDKADLFGYLIFSLIVGILFIIIGDFE